ncbi:hypothetical protein J4481_01390 [Candidatus Pacearchaeota archaeon]|nr:hypothetical protein [Candidatus Pacearchaeota archaeon]
MNFQFYFEKLVASEHFRNFMDEFPDAIACSCFFSIDVSGNKNDDRQHFDYFVPSTNKMYSFKLEQGCELIPAEMMGDYEPKRIGSNYNFDFEDVKKMILEKMKEEGIKNELQKILFSLQNVEGKDYLMGTIFLSGLGMLKVNILIEEMKITDFEKKSFMDMMNVFGKK